MSGNVTTAARESFWYAIENPDDVASPGLLIYPDRIRHNIASMIRDAGDATKLRPHVKTHKLPQVVQMKIAAGITRFKTATIAEAEMTAAAGGADVLLAYQPVGPNAARLIELIRRFPATRFSTIVDNADVASTLNAAAIATGLKIDVWLDLNVGMDRTGIKPGPEAHNLYTRLSESPGLCPVGLHAYDGHLHDADANKLTAAANTVFSSVTSFREQLIAAGHPVPKLIVGGTPTSPIHAGNADVEVGCGTTVLWDAGQPTFTPPSNYVNAAVLLTRVVSKPASDLLCFDLGHKAVASEMPHPRVVLFGLEDATPIVHSEEHLVVRTERAAEYPVGTTVYGLPWHICPTVALHGFVNVVENSRVVDNWPVVARERKLTI